MRRMHEVKEDGDVKTFHCEICEQSYSCLTSLQIHKQEQHERSPLNCNICNFACKSQSAMREHKLIHLELRDEEKRFQCENCDYASNAKGNFDRHRRTHDAEKKTFNCDTCSASFTSHESYARHKRRHDDAFQPVKCTECDFETMNSGDLASHLRTHAAAKPFICGHPSCDYAGKTERRLQRHKLRHETA